jgi:hypothetical protein
MSLAKAFTGAEWAFVAGLSYPLFSMPPSPVFSDLFDADGTRLSQGRCKKAWGSIVPIVV